MLDWKQLGERTYQAQNVKFDFHLRQEGRARWVLDIFDVNVLDPEAAFEDSQVFSSDDLAKEYAHSLG